MINSREIVDKYSQKNRPAYENAKRQGVYRNSKYVCCLLLLVTLFSYPDNRLFALSAEDSIPDLCELPEDASAFKALLRDKFGEGISRSEIELLKKEMEFVGETERTDYFYSISERVRYALLNKVCIAQDKIPYRFSVGVVTDLLGNAIFHQVSLWYRNWDILNGKRTFSFETSGKSEKYYTKIISKNTVGIMNKKQLEEYMESLDCSKLETDKQGTALFLYRIEREKDLSSRFSGNDFSKEILVDFDAEGIVEKVTVNPLGF